MWRSRILSKITACLRSNQFCRLYNALMGNESWVSDLHDADAILVATHSQGSVVSTHLLNRLIEEGHIVTALSARAMPDELIGVRRVQRVCCLALCGIHLGPLRYLSSSSLLQPYFQVGGASFFVTHKLTDASSILKHKLPANCLNFRIQIVRSARPTFRRCAMLFIME